jgi:hypothetical protein
MTEPVSAAVSGRVVGWLLDATLRRICTLLLGTPEDRAIKRAIRKAKKEVLPRHSEISRMHAETDLFKDKTVVDEVVHRASGHPGEVANPLPQGAGARTSGLSRRLGRRITETRPRRFDVTLGLDVLRGGRAA